jgi:hypothetical protein
MHHVVVQSVGIKGGEKEERFAILVLQNPPPPGESMVVGGPDGGREHHGYTRSELERQLASVYGVEVTAVMPS